MVCSIGISRQANSAPASLGIAGAEYFLPHTSGLTTHDNGGNVSRMVEISQEDWDALLERVTTLELAINGMNPTEVKSPKRGTRLPAEYLPPKAVIDTMQVQFPQVLREEWVIEHQTFVDYWTAQPGQRGVKLDWDATWRNWMRKAFSADKYQRRLTSGSGPVSTVDSKIANLQSKKGAQRSITQATS